MVPSPKKLSHRVLLVDDHRLILDGVRDALKNSGEFEVVGEATTGSQVMPLVNRTNPDIVMLDIRMPGMDGLVCLDQIKARNPEIKVIVLSASSDQKLIENVLKRGASAYIVKSVNPIDLPSVIRQAIDGTVYTAIGMPDDTSMTAAKSAGLTSRELAILTALAQGLSNAAIAKQLWVAPQTVKFHLTNIYRKLSVGNRTEAARYAYQQGLVESPMYERITARERLRASVTGCPARLDQCFVSPRDQKLEGVIVLELGESKADRVRQSVCSERRDDVLEPKERSFPPYVGERADELVTAEAHDHVVRTELQPQHRRNSSQHRVSGEMSLLVVHGLEIVDIDEGEDEWYACPARALELPFDFVEAETPQTDARELVDSRKVPLSRRMRTVLGCRNAQRSRLLPVLYGTLSIGRCHRPVVGCARAESRAAVGAYGDVLDAA